MLDSTTPLCYTIPMLNVALHILAGIGTMVVGASLTFSYLTIRDAMKD